MHIAGVLSMVYAEMLEVTVGCELGRFLIKVLAGQLIGANQVQPGKRLHRRIELMSIDLRTQSASKGGWSARLST